MALNLKIRNIKRNDKGVILSGSATLVDNYYSPNPQGNHKKNHTKQRVIERLGKVLWLDPENKKRGIFDSPERGLVLYDLEKDEFTPVSPADSRLDGTKHQIKPARIHTSFGNVYLFFNEMEKTVLMNVLRKTFGSDRQLYEKVLAHLSHDCLKNGSSIKCGEFLDENALSYLLWDIPVSTLDCDTAYYTALSDDRLKTAFFQNLITQMRKTLPEFGRACYVDSTPLPGEAENNPFNALCSHGTDGAVIQSRLVLILDIQTNIPVWFEVIPANGLDKSTILSVTRDVKVTLDVDIDMCDLDAGYARRELFELFNRKNVTYTDDAGKERSHTVLVRMPAALGYPYNELYVQCKPDFYRGKYSFDYEHHTFFGERIEVELFGYPEFAYVYVDRTQAESLLRSWREPHLEEWNALTESQQDWYQVKDGFFVLVGNKEQSPKETLIEYRGRTDIEGFFRDGKAYLKILPLAKWNKQTVTGKIFHDIMEITFYRAYRKQAAPAGMTMSSLLVSLESWECFRQDNDLLEVKTPKTQVREIMEDMGYTVPAHISLNDLRRQIFDGIPMDQTPVTQRKKKAGRKPAQMSPEEILAQKEENRIAKIRDAAESRMRKVLAKARDQKEKAEKKAESDKEKALMRAQTALEKAEARAKREQTREKVRMTYEQSVAAAEVKYSQALGDAAAAYQKAEADARTVCEQEIAAGIDRSSTDNVKAINEP